MRQKRASLLPLCLQFPKTGEIQVNKLAEQTETEGLLLSSAYLRLFDNDFN